MSDSKVAVVLGVGAAQGLGAAVAKRFARQGYAAVVAGRTAANLDAVVRQIQELGGVAHAVITDAASEEQVTELLARAEQFGPVRAAIYNAGGNNPQSSLKTSGKFFEEQWRVGTYGGFVFAREAVKAMLPREQGTLLFTGASASLRGRPNFVAFASAKAGLRAVSQSFAREFGPKGIHVAHVVIDGAIDGHPHQYPGAAAGAGEGRRRSAPISRPSPRATGNCICSTARRGRRKSICGPSRRQEPF